jgi:putative nucleotidyltransferase with HDIG domain
MRPDRARAERILREYTESEALARHAWQVAAVMRYLARQAGEEAELWEVVGLLHDLDYEKFPEQHCVKVREILESKGIDEEIIRAVVSHGWGLCSEVEPKSQMEKTLYAVDELTGLIYAASLMRPSKSVLDMEAKSVKKKFKDKAFAAKVDREVIKKGAALLEVELEELIAMTLEGMKEAEQDLTRGK